MLNGFSYKSALFKFMAAYGLRFRWDASTNVIGNGAIGNRTFLKRFELWKDGKKLVAVNKFGGTESVFGIVEGSSIDKLENSAEDAIDEESAMEAICRMLGKEMFLKVPGGWVEYYEEGSERIGKVADTEEEFAVKIDLLG